MGKAILPSILFRVDISQKPNPMMAFCTPCSLYIRIMYVKCHDWIRLLRGFVFGRYLMLTAVTFLYTIFDSELVYQAEQVAPISNKFYIGEAPSEQWNCHCVTVGWSSVLQRGFLQHNEMEKFHVPSKSQ
jgi:hypothetical protein